MSAAGGRPYVFLDRDGTLIEDRGYPHRLADYAPLPGAVEAVRLLRAAGFGVAIVTNQSGIARGYFGEEDFRAFQAHLERDFAAQGAPIDASYHCPHLPDAGCACRKPSPGLVLRAARELGADLAASWVVGDQASDAELAARAGCRAVVVGAGARAVASPIATEPDLLAAARRIVRESRGAR
jgi:D-glycero-D-manno-heptose 1,7-bisphosphate phosphatase